MIVSSEPDSVSLPSLDLNIALSIVICSAGNASLAGLLKPDGNFLDHHVFEEVQRIGFFTLKGFFKKRPKLCAQNPKEWFTWLMRSNVRKLSLVAVEAFGQSAAWEVASGAGEGVDWFIVEGSTPGSVAWKIDSSTRFDSLSSDRTTSTKFLRTDLPREIRKRYPCQSLRQSHSRLEKALSDCHEFTTSQALTLFTELFHRALRSLHSSEPHNFADYNLLISPERYPPMALQLIVAATTAWVFGIENSWNALNFHDPPEERIFDEVSQELHEALIEAIVTACNAFSP